MEDPEPFDETAGGFSEQLVRSVEETWKAAGRAEQDAEIRAVLAAILRGQGYRQRLYRYHRPVPGH